MVRSLPRASAGLSRLAASPVPAAPPAPINVWASSMNRMIGTGLASTSSMTWRSRFSNSPLTLAPACNNPMSSERSVTLASEGGTSPSTMRRAKPSATAVLPTPASPVRIGLFWRRRNRMSMTWRISASRPTILSISPDRAFAVRSTENLASADSPCGVPEAASSPPALPAPATGAASPLSPTIAPYCSPSCSTLILRHSREMASITVRRLSLASRANSACPGLMREAPNCKEAYIQPCWTASINCCEKSSELAPRGSLSSAATMSLANWPSSTPNLALIAAISLVLSALSACNQCAIST